MTFVANQLEATKKTAIFIVTLCVVGILMGVFVQNFKTDELNWFYRYGSLVNHILLLVSGSWSLVFLLLFLADRSKSCRKCLPWALLGATPVIYISVMLFSVM